MALAVLMTGPVLLFAPYVLFTAQLMSQVVLVGAGIGYLQADATKAYKRTPAMRANILLYNVGYYAAAGLMCLGCLAATPVGLLLTAWPAKRVVDEVDVPRPGGTP